MEIIKQKTKNFNKRHDYYLHIFSFYIDKAILKY